MYEEISLVISGFAHIVLAAIFYDRSTNMTSKFEAV